MAAPRYMVGATDASPDDLAKLEALAGLPITPDMVAPAHKSALGPAVNAALNANAAQLAKVQQIVADAEAAAEAGGQGLEVLDPDPAQARLNLQLALNRLVSDIDAQEMARTQGTAFQRLYNLTNDQMLTLCRLAVDVGAYKQTDDLNRYMNEFSNLPSIIKSLSPGALQKLGLGGSADDGLIGSCSCCCP